MRKGKGCHLCDGMPWGLWGSTNPRSGLQLQALRARGWGAGGLGFDHGLGRLLLPIMSGKLSSPSELTS